MRKFEHRTWARKVAALALLFAMPAVITTAFAGMHPARSMAEQHHAICGTRHGLSCFWTGPTHGSGFSNTAAQYRFVAECSMRCVDGSCERVCVAGATFSVDEGSVRLQAEAKLRAEVNARGGVVVEGSVKVEVKFDSEAEVKLAQGHRYNYSFHAMAFGGEVVSSADYNVDSNSDAEADAAARLALLAWGDRLEDMGIKYSGLRARLLNKTPLR